MSATLHIAKTGRSALLALTVLAMVVAGCGQSPSEPKGTALPDSTPTVNIDPGNLAFLPSPEEGDVPPLENLTASITGFMVLGQSAPLAAQTIGTVGGTIDAEGLRLEVPEGALAAETPISITRTPVESADFEGRFTPLTPLYTIEIGDAALTAPVIITLPATVLDVDATLLFYYDEAAGTLTPLAPVGADATSITAAAIHFSKIVGGVFHDATGALDSGFRPGFDDWQFPNRGSRVAPKGHCEGQSDTAIWYYIVKRGDEGASPLYGLYDNNGADPKTPTLWPDDSDGYRFVSSVQADPIANKLLYWTTTNRLYGRADDRMTYTALRAAIAFSGEPQEISISAGDKPQHAMVVYRVTADRLFIADPNYPGKLRTIKYDAATGRLAPYTSGANASDIAAKRVKIYTKFAYVPWRSAASEAAIAVHWAEFESGQAGDAVFPKYTLEAKVGVDEAGADVWAPLTDGFATVEKQLKISLSDPTNTDSGAMQIFSGSTSTPLESWNPVIQTVDLIEGANSFGIAIYFDRKADGEPHYVDFVRLTITRQAASPTPAAGSHWELVSSAKGQEFAATGSISDGQLGDPDVNGYSGTGAWPTPPSVLTPGQSVAVALSASISPTCSAAEANVPGLDGETPGSHAMILSATWAFPYGPRTEIGSVVANCLHAEVSQSFDWVVPEATDDTTHFGLTIQGGVDMGDRHAYEYVYEWRP